MISRVLLLSVLISLAAVSIAFGQSKEKESDPFKNDPFFSKPLDEL
jgi:hypothetical protein